MKKMRRFPFFAPNAHAKALLVIGKERIRKERKK